MTGEDIGLRGSVLPPSSARPALRRSHVGRTIAVVAGSSSVLLPSIQAAVRLTPQETARCARVSGPGAQQDFLAARIVARLVVAAVTAQAPKTIALIQECPRCRGRDHGRPRVSARPRVHVSWSHTEGVVAAVASLDRAGIDVERRPAVAPDDRLLVRVLGPLAAARVRESPDPTHDFLRRWTTRECLVKVGMGSLAGEFDEARLALEHRLSVHGFTHDDPGVVGSCVSSGPVRFVGLEEIVPEHS